MSSAESGISVLRRIMSLRMHKRQLTVVQHLRRVIRRKGRRADSRKVKPRRPPCSAKLTFVAGLRRFIDLFSRRVVGWSTQSRMTTDLALQALLMAV